MAGPERRRFDAAETAREVLERCRVIAVVGLSPDPSRPSHGVAAYLKQHGYTIIPVHPTATEILGETAYPSLLDIPESIAIEVVEVFRRPEYAMVHAEEAVERGVDVLWLQDGVIDEEAARLASDAGLTVVMDRCMARDHATMFS